MEYYDNSILKFDGEYLNGKRWNGKGYDINNNLIYELKDGKGFINKYKIFFYGYSGKMIFEDRYRFRGQIINGELNGNGEDSYGDFIFKGEYLNGKRWNGRIKEDIINGIFEGEYLNGKRNGEGKEYDDCNRLIFEGQYKNGKRLTGKIKEYDDNGRLIFDGEYLNGYKLNGKGYDSNGNIIYELKNGKEEKNGKGIELLNNNIIFEGEYLKGKRWNGTIRQYCWNKLLFECQYINGEINGKGKEYDYNNDKIIIFEGEYLNGKRWNGIVFDTKDNEMYELKDGKGNITIL